MKKILLIEDDKDQIILYRLKFEASGYKLFSVQDGQSGLDMAEKEQPDVVLIDLLMEGMGGLEVLKNLKKNPKTKNIPAIIVTNLDKSEMAGKALALGAVDFIYKSKIPLREMMPRIESHIRKD